ncbi:MAG: hypothetical protein OEM24_09090 [Paracoccaceae bacterium]|nr:hypothetical protein [Paracoccaceae bacterium]
MQPQFLHLKRPRRRPFYFAAGVGVLYLYLLSEVDGPTYAFLCAGLFVAGMVWLGLRHPPAGMEIREGRWDFFIGQSRGTVLLGDIGAVRVEGSRGHPEGLALRLRDGRTIRLPAALTPDLGALERVLARRGIRLEA